MSEGAKVTRLSNVVTGSGRFKDPAGECPEPHT